MRAAVCEVLALSWAPSPLRINRHAQAYRQLDVRPCMPPHALVACDCEFFFCAYLLQAFNCHCVEVAAVRGQVKVGRRGVGVCERITPAQLGGAGTWCRPARHTFSL